MARITTPCPQCHQQMIADVQQVFDVGQDAADKERLLGGSANIAVCPSCGFQSALAVPLVYHDPEKELLLTYYPSEAGTPLAEQEKELGPLISQVVNNLPLEKRKGYLFQPQAMLTYDTLIEKILEADGITKEMIADQKKRVSLLREMITTSEDTIKDLVKQNETLIDENFFTIFNQMKQGAAQMRDQASLDRIKAIQKILLTDTAYGRELKSKAESAQKAVKDLQDLGEKLNQDSLLELVLNAPDDAYLQTIVGLARNGMDYTFFTKLSAKIEKAEGETKARYVETREKLISLTQKIDVAIQEATALRKTLLEEILKQENMEQAVVQSAQAIDQTFLDAANSELAAARKNGDFMRSGKIQQLLDIIQKLSTPPAEMEAMEKLLQAEDENAIRALIQEKPEMITDNLKSMVNALIAEEGNAEELTPEIVDKLKMIKAVIG